jgi:hypothetical protein
MLRSTCAVGFLCVAFAAGCTERLKEAAPTDEGRGVRRALPPPIDRDEEAVDEEELDEEGSGGSDNWRPEYGLAEGQTAETEAAALEAAKDKRPAELSRLLHGQLSSVAGCLSDEVRTAVAPHVSISVSATVTASGRVSSAFASSSVLPASALDCVRSQALAASFPPSETNDIVQAQTVVELNVTAPIKTERLVLKRNGVEVAEITDPAAFNAPPPVKGGSTTAPAYVLPATAGGNGPAPGAAPPGSTLPATGGNGPAPGAVPPGSTLPALGPAAPPPAPGTQVGGVTVPVTVR